MGIINSKSVKCTSNHKDRKTKSYLLQRARKYFDSSFVIFALFTFLTVNVCDALELVLAQGSIGGNQELLCQEDCLTSDSFSV